MADSVTERQGGADAVARRGPNDELSGWADALLLSVALAYAGLVAFLTFTRGAELTEDVLAVAAAFAVAMVVRSRVALLREWMPFLVLFLAYELMRGLADDVGMPVHLGDVAAAERFFFAGHLPTAVLQGALHPLRGVDWLAVAGTVVYMLHFILPLATAMVLWRLRPALFHPYMVALILLSFAGFVTYLFLPVAPPWLAAQLGEVGRQPGEVAVTYLKPAAFAALVGLIGLDGSRLYDITFTSLNANPVAAFPSLHAAYPFLTFLVLRRAFGAWSWLAFAYFAFVALTVVYTADHYVIDVAGGVLYASAAYVLMWWLARRRIRGD
jgi:membrane-associated phospholipid phosphatase